jgi:uncharacterized membrane protein YhaH (DUF805 family)
MQGLRPFFRYFEFSGRSGRAEFWQYMAYIFIVSMLLSLLELRALMESAAMGVSRVPIWSTIFSLVTFIPGMAAIFRRLHDRNKSGWLIGGWYIFIAAILVVMIIGAATSDSAAESAIWPLVLAMFAVAFIAGIYIIVELALPGDEFENDYGWPDNEPFDIQAKFGGSRTAARTGVAATPRAPRAQTEDSLARIERLADLHAKGHLTAEEFTAQKARLLDGMA